MQDSGPMCILYHVYIYVCIPISYVHFLYIIIYVIISIDIQYIHVYSHIHVLFRAFKAHRLGSRYWSPRSQLVTKWIKKHIYSQSWEKVAQFWQPLLQFKILWNNEDAWIRYTHERWLQPCNLLYLPSCRASCPLALYNVVWTRMKQFVAIQVILVHVLYFHVERHLAHFKAGVR